MPLVNPQEQFELLVPARYPSIVPDTVEAAKAQAMTRRRGAPERLSALRNWAAGRTVVTDGDE